MKIVKNLLLLLLGIILGMVLVVGGVAGAGYLLLTKEGMVGTVSDTIAKNSTFELQLSDTIRSMSIMNYGKELFAKASNIETLKIGDLEEMIGMSPISEAVEKLLGVPKADIKACTVQTLPTAVMDGLSLDSVTTKFNIKFPDLPLFKDPDFTKKSITAVMDAIDNLTLDSFIAVTYPENATPTQPESIKLLQKLGKKTLNQVSSGMEGIVNELQLSDILVIDANSPKILASIADCSVATIKDANGNIVTLGIQDRMKTLQLNEMIETSTEPIWKYLGDATLDTMSDKVDNLTLSNLMEISETSPQIMKVIKDCSLTTRYNEDSTVKSMGIQEKMNELTMKDILVIDEKSPKIMKALADCTMTSITKGDGTKTVSIQDKMNELTMDDILVIDATSPKIMRALAGCTMTSITKGDGTKTVSIQEKMNQLTMDDILIIDDKSPKIMQALAGCTMTTITLPGGGQSVSIQDRINTLTIADAIEIKPTDNIMLQRLATYKITEMGSGIDSVLAETTIGELLKINKADPNTEPILKALCDSKLTGASLNETMKTLTIADCFKDSSSGVLGLIPSDTPLTNIATVLGNTIATTNMYKLCKLDVFKVNVGDNVDTQAFFYNKSATDIIQGYIGVLNGGTGGLVPTYVQYTGDTITQAELTRLNIADGATLIITKPTTIPENEVFTTKFNIDVQNNTASSPQPPLATTGWLTIGANVKVDSTGFMFIRGNEFVTGISNITSATTFKNGAQTIQSVEIVNTAYKPFTPPIPKP